MSKLRSVALPQFLDSSESATPNTGKPRRARTRAVNQAIPRAVGLVDMVRIACLAQYRLAALIGAIIGGSVPFAVYSLSHYCAEHGYWTRAAITADSGLNSSVLCAALVLGGLLYSVFTVAEMVGMAVQSRAKGIGFTVLMEGIMTAAPSGPHELGWLAVYALALLITINAVGTAVKLARGSTMHGSPADVS